MPDGRRRPRPDRFGFPSVATLRRTFRAEHGMSTEAYHRRGHREFG